MLKAEENLANTSLAAAFSLSKSLRVCWSSSLLSLCEAACATTQRFIKLVQSARGFFPRVSFRFPLKAMNTLNRPRSLIAFNFPCEEMGVFAVLEEIKTFVSSLTGCIATDAVLADCVCVSRTKLCLRARQRERKKERGCLIEPSLTRLWQ